MKAKELNKHIINTFEFIDDLIIITNTNLEILHINKALLDRTNYSKKELIQKNIENLISSKNIDLIQKFLSKKEPISISRTHIKTKEKKDILVDIKGIPIENDNKKFVCLLIKDNYFIAGTNNKEGYFALLKALPDLLFVIDKKGNFLDYHTVSEQDLLVKKEQIINNNIKNIIPKELHELHFNNIEAAIKTQKVQTFTYSLLTGGKKNHFEARMIAINDNEIFSLVRNITERITTQIKLEQKNQIFNKAEKTGEFGTFVADTKKNSIWFSDSLKLMFNIEENKNVSLKLDFSKTNIHPDDIPKIQQKIKFLQETGKKTQLEIRTLYNQYLSCFHVVAEINQTNKEEIIGIIQDITKRKAYEKKIIERENEYKTLAENLPEVITRTNKQGKAIFVSPSIEQFFGITPEKILGKHIREFPFPPKNIKRWEEAINEIIETGTKKVFLGEIEVKTGTMYFEHQILPEYDINGEITSFLSVARNITEEYTIKQKLEQSKKDFENLADFSPAGILIRDNKRVYYANKASLDIFGISTDELFNINIIDSIILPEYKKEIKERTEKVMNGGEVPFVDIKIRRPFDGKIINIESKLSKITYQGKELLQVVFRDISLQREVMKMQIRAELAEESNISLQEEVKTRKEIEKELKKSLNQKEILLKEVHHRVKNNMQIISSILNLQCNKIEEGKTKDILIDSKERIRSMSLVHENLYRSKDFDNINFPEYLVNILSNLSLTYKLNPQKIKIITDVENTIIPLEKSIPIGLIVNELITNAIKHAFKNQEKGEINISLKTDKNATSLLVIKDNGPGVKEFKNLKKNVGLEIVESLSDQLDAKLVINTKNGMSYHFEIKNLVENKTDN
jgi:PAS domain S-box-containing protein